MSKFNVVDSLAQGSDVPIKVRLLPEHGMILARCTFCCHQWINGYQWDLNPVSLSTPTPCTNWHKIF